MKSQFVLAPWSNRVTAPLFAVMMGLLSLMPPSVIGTGTSALTLQSLEHWRLGTPDSFTVTHVHWLWIPSLFAFVTGSAFSALVIFRALLITGSVLLFHRTLRSRHDPERSFYGIVLLSLSVLLLYYSHTFAVAVPALFTSIWVLYLLERRTDSSWKLAALVIGLSISISMLAFGLLVGLFISYAKTELVSRKAISYLLLMLAGAGSWLALQIFYFGADQLSGILFPRAYDVQETTNVIPNLLLAVYCLNLLLIPLLRGTIELTIFDVFLPAAVIAVMIFGSPIEPMAIALAVVLPAVILQVLARAGESLRGYTTGYAVLQLALFFIMPLMNSEPQTAMPQAQRTVDKDASAWKYYSNNCLLSSAKLYDIKHGESEAIHLLRRLKLDSATVIIDGSAAQWLDGGTLGAGFPRNRFAFYYGRPLNSGRVNGLVDTEFIMSSIAAPRVIGMFEKSFTETFIDSTLPIMTEMVESDRLRAFLLTKEEDKRAFIDRMLQLHYHSFH